MNGSTNFVGRLSPGFLTHSLGVLNVHVAAAFCCTILIFAIIGLRNIPCSVTNAVLFAYSTGLCKCRAEMAFKVSMSYSSVTTLPAPFISFLTTDVSVSELGYVVIKGISACSDSTKLSDSSV